MLKALVKKLLITKKVYMTKEIISVKVADLDEATYNILYELNHGWYGYMQKILDYCRNNTCPAVTNGLASYIVVDDIIVGWSLIFNIEVDNINQHIQYLYVNRNYRKHGYGSELASHGASLYSDLVGHTNESSCFKLAGIASADDYYKDYIDDFYPVSDYQ